MSKIGTLPIKFNSDKIKINVEKGGEYNHLLVKISGPKGEDELSLRKGVNVEIKGDEIIVERKNDSIANKSLHGLYRSLIANMIHGVDEGYEKKLEIHGVGYRGESKETGVIELKVGYSHSVEYKSSLEGVDVTMEDANTIVISGYNKQKVGQVAAEIRDIKKPEPYKGKGIRYQNEQIRRKAGKAGIAAG